NRICVYIAFFALFGLALLLQRAAERYARTRRARVAFALGLGVLLAVGVLDQTSGRFVPPYAALAKEFRHDTEFIGRIEATVPDGTRVFPLPYLSFVEHVAPDWMGAYDPLRPYLHSRRLRWSYGAMVGRGTDRWQRRVAEAEPPEMLAELSRAGFGGIWIDRVGIPDRGARIETALIR